MRVKKTIKGEVVPYKVKLIPNTMTAEVRFWSDDEPVIGQITEDLKYLILPDTFLSPYLSEHGRVKVGKLKFTTRQQMDVRDYNSIKFNLKK